MIHDDFIRWQTLFCEASGLHPDDATFTDGWYFQLEPVELCDATEALKALPGDPRVIKTPPRDRLPIVLEHAQEARRRRLPVWVHPLKDQPVPEMTTAWNENLLRLGIITKAEFRRREREKERAS